MRPLPPRLGQRRESDDGGARRPTHEETSGDKPWIAGVRRPDRGCCMVRGRFAPRLAGRAPATGQSHRRLVGVVHACLGPDASHGRALGPAPPNRRRRCLHLETWCLLAGSTINHDFDKEEIDLTPRQLEQSGGEEDHVLTLDELPSHAHIQVVGQTGGGRYGEAVRGWDVKHDTKVVDIQRTRSEGAMLHITTCRLSSRCILSQGMSFVQPYASMTRMCGFDFCCSRWRNRRSLRHVAPLAAAEQRHEARFALLAAYANR